MLLLCFFFYVQAIVFTSCLGVALQIDNNRNKKQEVADKHLKIALLALDRLQTLPLFEGSRIKSIENSLHEFANDPSNGPTSVMPWCVVHDIDSTTNEEYLCTIIPLTKLTDYPENQRKALLRVVSQWVILNSYFYMRLQPLSEYAQAREDVLSNTSKMQVFFKIDDFALKAQERYKNGVMFGDVLCEALKDIAKYVDLLLRMACKSGYKKSQKCEAVVIDQ